MKIIARIFISIITVLNIYVFTTSKTLNAQGEQLFVGWAVADITPEKPVALVGQLHKRISEAVQDPLNATVLAIETRGRDGRREQAIMSPIMNCFSGIMKRQKDR